MEKNIKRKTLKGVKWTLVQELSGQLIGFLVFLLLARMLLPQDFGLVALASALIAFLGPFITQGFGSALVQREHLEPEHMDTAFWVNVTIGSVLTVLVLLAAPFVANQFEQPELESVLVWLSLNFILLSLSSVQQAIVVRLMNFKVLAVRSIIAQVIGGGVGIAMALMEYGVWSLVARQLVQSIVSLMLLWRISDWRPSVRFSIPHFKDLFSFGINVMGSELLIFVNRRSDNLLIGYFLGPVALGYYTVAYRLLKMMLQLISKAISKVGMPAFARIQEDKKRVARGFYSMTQMTALVALPAFVGIAVLVPELVPTLFGQQWMPSIPVMQVLAFIGVVQCLIRPMISVIIGLGKPNWRLRIQVIDAIANVIGFLIAVQWGIVAVAISYVVVGYLLAPLWFLVVKRLVEIKLSEYLAALLAPLASVGVMIVAMQLLKYSLASIVPTALLIVLSIVIGSVVYCYALYRISPAAALKVLDVVKIFIPLPKKINT